MQRFLEQRVLLTRATRPLLSPCPLAVCPAALSSSANSSSVPLSAVGLARESAAVVLCRLFACAAGGQLPTAHQRFALFSFSPFFFFFFFWTSPAAKEPLFDHIRRERERSVVLLTLPLAFDSLCAVDGFAWCGGSGPCTAPPLLWRTPAASEPAIVKLFAQSSEPLGLLR